MLSPAGWWGRADLGGGAGGRRAGRSSSRLGREEEQRVEEHDQMVGRRPGGGWMWLSLGGEEGFLVFSLS